MNAPPFELCGIGFLIIGFLLIIAVIIISFIVYAINQLLVKLNHRSN